MKRTHSDLSSQFREAGLAGLVLGQVTQSSLDRVIMLLGFDIVHVSIFAAAQITNHPFLAYVAGILKL